MHDAVLVYIPRTTLKIILKVQKWLRDSDKYLKPAKSQPNGDTPPVKHENRTIADAVFVVGAAGFEPAISWSQTRRLNRAGPRPDR